jgi:hypothetical protein
MTAPTTGGHNMAVEPVATAGNSLNTNVYVAPRAATISAVTYVPVSAITGANTNTRSVSLVNKGQTGSGSTVVATLQFNSGVNAGASAMTSVTLSGTAANRVVAAGDVLQWQSAAVGTGIADPGGLVLISLSTNYA